ncbi:MAG: HAMP domain-containing histidine kinase [Deltaproteobacteria bacterium]|nr:HAMP domain-containing histidine kinase [Deltaproteobacteria bacterium]
MSALLRSVVATGASVLLTAAAIAFGWLLNVYLKQPVTFITFFPAIFAATWIGGRAGGIVSVGLTIPAALHYLSRGQGLLGAGTWAAVVFYLVGALLSVVTAAQLKAAIASRDMLISILGHDVKAPLTTISLQAELIRRTHRHSADLVTQANAIQRQAGRIQLLLDNLLDLSRVRAGRFTLTREELELGALVEGVVERFALDLEQAGCTVSVNVKDRPVRGSWDRICIEQVVANLVSNAMKYGRGRPIEISVAGRPGEASVTVRDTGRGIAPEDQGRVFDAFEGTPGTRGSHGLGLWIARELVRAHGGRIDLESEPDKGSTFEVVLPRAASA